MVDIPATDRRQQIRIRYSAGQYPEINIAGAVYPVSDLSAKGLIFISCDLGYRIRQPLFAFITFPDGTVVAVEGTILRMKIDQVIVRLTRGISTERILEESKRHQERNRPDSK